MYCTRAVTDDLIWVGGNDRRLALFEGAYKVPRGVSYNSYLLLDEQTVLFDTVDAAVSHVFFENLEHTLAGRPLDVLVVHHMEPDHAASIGDLLLRWPDVRIYCTAKARDMLKQFLGRDLSGQITLCKDGTTLSTGRHSLRFVTAPFVHWPEVMFSYDETDKILFSADAFGVFGALNGRLFADEVDFFGGSWLDEARRYYTNIVGKYGSQVQAALKKAGGLDIALVCPLHGFVWRQNFAEYLAYYQLWSTYTPEKKGVLIPYASVYGNTANAAELLAARLSERGVETELYDVSVTPADEILSQAFRLSHIVFISTTCNAGIFPAMEHLLHELVAHNLQKRTVAVIESGSWAVTSGKLMRELVQQMKNTTLLEQSLKILSTVAPGQEADIDALAQTLADSVNAE